MGQRILVHDYSGHPFQPQLSRGLATRGHEVLHVYSQSVLIPQGALTKGAGDSVNLVFSGITLPAVIDKQAYLQRFFRERAYGKLLDQEIRQFGPDVVISSSTPLDAQNAAMQATRAVGGKFVFWLQDIQGIAIERLIGDRFNGLGRYVGKYYTAMEKRLLRQSDAVVSITEDFGPTLDAWEVPRHKVHVIPNWASLEELPRRPKDNAWARAKGLADKFVFLYSGTLGLKHDPQVLVSLAIAYAQHPEVAVVVVTEGAKAEWLKKQKAEMGLEGLVVLPFQPYSDVPDMMGAADVLVAVLDPDAGTFSVPSKVLAYHCAGRPILLSVPAENLAARIVSQSKTGFVVEPGNGDAFLKAAEDLRTLPALREELGRNARAYAEQVFDIELITDRFEALFHSLLGTEPERAPVRTGLRERA